jgi:hypothetical protein
MPNLRKAIDGKCKDCIYDRHQPGRWREQVFKCTISTCSIWPVRAGATPPKGKVRKVVNMPKPGTFPLSKLKELLGVGS